MDLSEIRGEVTRRHPWELTRLHLFSNVLEKVCPSDKAYKILDVGAGDAWFSSELSKKVSTKSKFVCWDSGYGDKTENLLSKGFSNQFSFITEQPAEAFDLILMLDVLEHIENDKTFLSKVVTENLKDSGLVLISVPAWNWLFTQHDQNLKHFRRYSPANARHLVESSGLQILQHGCAFQSLIAVRMLQKLQEMLVGRKDNKTSGLSSLEGTPKLSACIESYLKVEADVAFSLSKYNVSIPGLSWWALCKRS